MHTVFSVSKAICIANTQYKRQLTKAIHNSIGSFLLVWAGPALPVLDIHVAILVHWSMLQLPARLQTDDIMMCCWSHAKTVHVRQEHGNLLKQYAWHGNLEERLLDVYER